MTAFKNFLPWLTAFFLALALLFARAAFPEIVWLSIALAVLVVANIGWLLKINSAALRTRTAAYGLNSLVTTLLVFCIVGVINFIAVKYPKKIDFTKSKVNTLSDQSVKAVRTIPTPIEAVVYGRTDTQDQIRSLLQNYREHNSKLTIEFVDPEKEPGRTRQAGIKSPGTLVLSVNGREARVEAVTEEKVTNALLKLAREHAPTVCWITGHGEKDPNAASAEGYELSRKLLEGQSYTVTPLDFTGANGLKIPETCSAILVIGPTKAFFSQEVKLIRDYLIQGGRALFALDINVRANPVDPAPEMTGLVKEWGIELLPALVIDPVSRQLNVEPTMPIIPTFSKEHAITKDLPGTNVVFPFTRPITLGNGPGGAKVQWLTQSTPNAWGETNMASLAKGAVQFENGDLRGPVFTGAAIEAKHPESKSSRATRLAVFGTSQFATNAVGRFGSNSDLFANAVSWVANDDSLISIRSHEEVGGIIQLDQRRGTIVFLLTVFVFPLLLTVGGIAFWAIRRRM